MPGQHAPPRPPRDFLLVQYEALDDVVSEAGRLAAAGAEEGTVVWALRQSDAKTPGGATWLGSEGDLHCALVLRPEFTREIALQLVYVAALSVGAVLSEQVSAMTTLHYRWPNEILLREGKVGCLRLHGQPSAEGFDWLALGLDLNVAAVPESVAFSAAAVQPDGECDVSHTLLLERYCRHFLRMINRWAEEGFSPILTAWLQRVPDIDNFVRVRHARGTTEGVLQQVNEAGAAVVRADAGVTVVTLSEFYAFQ